MTQDLVSICWDILYEPYLKANPKLDMGVERKAKRQINNRLHHLPEEEYDAIIERHMRHVSNENKQLVSDFVSEVAPYSRRGA